MLRNRHTINDPDHYQYSSGQLTIPIVIRLRYFIGGVRVTSIGRHYLF